MQLSLYLHFPFCKQKCLYCSFVSAPCSREGIHAYCEALIREIHQEGKAFPDAEITSVFFGGGTPSIVPEGEMKPVLEALHRHFRFCPDAEFTSEANPATLTPEWLDTMINGGLNRLSLGMQAKQEDLLKRIGRIHTFEEVAQSVRLANQAGINNINLDLMFGLPGQKLNQYLDSIQSAADLGAKHISAYSLILEEGTPLATRVAAGDELLPGEDETAEMYEQGIAFLEKLGYGQYEVSNFAREGYTCRHNLGYWQFAWYLGLGVAAHSMLPAGADPKQRGILYCRRSNTENKNDYIEAAHSNAFEKIRQFEPIAYHEAAFETIMLGLRTKAGVDQKAFFRRFGKSPEQLYPRTLPKLLHNGLAQEEGDRLCLTPRGLEIQNRILLEFMEELPFEEEKRKISEK